MKPEAIERFARAMALYRRVAVAAAAALEASPARAETFFAIRRTDGESIFGDFAWMGCEGPDDWTIAEEEDPSFATEYEIVRMHVESVEKRTFGEPPAEDDDESRMAQL